MSKQTIYVADNMTIKWAEATPEGDTTQYCLHIQRDDEPTNPREEDDGIFTFMATFHRNYKLGNNLPSGMKAGEFWRELVRNHVPRGEITRAIEEGRLNGIRIAPNEDDPNTVDVYEVSSVLGREPKEYLEHEGIPKDELADYIVDDDDLGIAHCMELMKPYAVWLPLYLYDHSGLTITCGERTGVYADAFDSSAVGWILAVKSDVLRIMGRVDEANWRERALSMMRAEIEVYDQYLRGEVYGYTLYERQTEDDEWEETESVWGFYGDDINENGILDSAPGSLSHALENGEYEIGEAVRKTVTFLEF